MRGKGALFFIIIIILNSPITITQIPTTSYEDKESFHHVAEADVNQMFDDVDLIEEPDYNIAGDSGEFSYYHSAFYDNDQGVSMLIWDHVANTSIETNDGVYIEKDFEWQYDEYPKSMHISIEFAFNVSGDFSYYNSRYASMSFWFDTPYGETSPTECHFISSGYYYQNYTVDCQELIGSVWKDYTNDPSTDKNGTAKLCIGLFPGFEFFLGSPETVPWQHVTGSVQLLVKSLDFVMTRGTPEDSEEVASPVYESPWKTSPANKDDIPPDLSYDIHDECIGIVSLDDETVVSVMHSHYNDVVNVIDDMVILHWGPTTSLLRTTRVIDCEPSDITTDGQDIYVTGTSNMNAFLSKYNPNGELIWNRTIDSGLNEQGKLVAVDTEGSVYWFVERFDVETGWHFADSSLYKLDEDGTDIWNQFLNLTHITEMYTGNNTSLFTYEPRNQLLKTWDSDGNVLTTREGIDSFRVYDKDLITLSIEYVGTSTHKWGLSGQYILERTGPSGQILWSKAISIQLYPDYQEHPFLIDFDVAPDGSILLLFYLERFSEEYRLYRYFANGTLDNYQVIGWAPRISVWYSDYDIAVNSNGLVYFFATEFQTYENYFADPVFKIEAYNYTTYTRPLILNQILPYVLLFSGIAGILAVSLLLRRRKNLEPMSV